jgi:tRNA-specific 2-thiouridylase
VGRHRGHHGFTVGQRKGIGVSGPEPYYVLSTSASANTVTVGPREALATTRVRVRAATLHRPGGEVDAIKLRYRSRALPCRLAGEPLVAGVHASLEVDLFEPVMGAAPGQSACLLRGDTIVGWATIDRPTPS